MHQQAALLTILLAGALAPRAHAAAAAGAAGRVCVDPTLCLSWSHNGTDITFSAVCLPPPGAKQLFWCAFGISNATPAAMFPAQVTALQLDPRTGAVSVEDRDSFVGFQSPPCYAAAQISRLLPGARGTADGGISAGWTRPLALASTLLAAHMLDVEVAPGALMTLLGASSADTAAAAARCEPAMQLHTLCVPGVPVAFGGAAAAAAAVAEAEASEAAAPRTYLYFPNSDIMSVNETIFPESALRDVAALSAACDALPGCVGFNSNGWFKNGTTSLAPNGVDVYLLAPTPAPAPPPPLWPLPRNSSFGAAPLVVDAGLRFSAVTPSDDLAAAFARFESIIFSHAGGAAGAAAAAAARRVRGVGAEAMSSLVVDVADVAAPLDLGVDESYWLTLPADGSPGTLRAATVWGALAGLQTLAQLVRFDFDARAYWVDAAPVAIEDAPAFAWRGLMVDPARQFLPLATLRAVVDAMAVAKLNTLHVHILDCDSFPVEVAPPFENLWAGAFSPRERYSAADLAGLVEFARLRGVRVVLEFDQPGHMGAMCKAYPQLCPSPPCSASYGSDVLDPSSAATLPAMQAVVDALVGATIDSVLHLGGDEVGDACWLASPAVRAWMSENNVTTGDGIYEYFVQKSNAMALAAGKSPMRWEEVWKHFGTQLDPRTIVHAWLSSAALFDARGVRPSAARPRLARTTTVAAASPASPFMHKMTVQQTIRACSAPNVRP